MDADGIAAEVIFAGGGPLAVQQKGYTAVKDEIAAAGRDDLVSTSAIEEFAIHLRAGAHLIVPGAMHEILMEQDHYRRQFWAAFDAFVPGTPLFG